MWSSQLYYAVSAMCCQPYASFRLLVILRGVWHFDKCVSKQHYLAGAQSPDAHMGWLTP
jgi:hypothetical protein